jgi:hypothetical protein
MVSFGRKRREMGETVVLSLGIVAIDSWVTGLALRWRCAGIAWHVAVGCQDP